MRHLMVTRWVAGVLTLAGCQDLTSVDAPDVIQPEDYASAAGATVLAAGAITQFHVMFGGAQGQVIESGLMADELTVTGPGSTTLSDWDRRSSLDPAVDGVLYVGLQDTRQRFLSAVGVFQQAAPDSTTRIGQLFALLGYTSVFLGENFCAGVPLSRRDADLRPVYGQPLTTTELFDSALAAFDSALMYGADSARIVNLARLGRARALLNQGRFGDAAAAVAAVPTDYVYNVTYLASGEFNNGLAGSTDSPQNTVTVPNREGTNGNNWRTAVGDTAPDPRAVVVNRSPGVIGMDNVTEVWQYAAYQMPEAPIRLTGGVEARLIEAEAALQSGDVGTWLAIHNTLRAAVTGLEPLVDPGSPAPRVDMHFRERAFWLFLTGQRLGDLRRLVRQYGQGPESVFPTGAWRDGQRYDAATSMAPPATQTANPHYSGCLNRDA